MRAIQSSLTCLLLLLFTVQSGKAWGPTGHRAVGLIAERYLSERASLAVRGILGPDSLAEVSTWADEIRSDPAWNHASTWHYISVEDDETLEDTERNPAGDVLEALRRFEGVLRDSESSREKKADAIKWMVHLIGDLHQPLHVGRRDDRGGNEIEVRWFGQTSNLHRVWDSGIIDSQDLSYSELADFIDDPTLPQIRQWQDSDYEQWAQESFDLRSQVYDIGDKNLRWEYRYHNWPAVERRLLQAGIRLAGKLNDIFDHSGQP